MQTNLFINESDERQILSLYSRSENEGLLLFFKRTLGHLNLMGEGNLPISQGPCLIGPYKDFSMKELILS